MGWPAGWVAKLQAQMGLCLSQRHFFSKRSGVLQIVKGKGSEKYPRPHPSFGSPESQWKQRSAHSAFLALFSPQLVDSEDKWKQIEQLVTLMLWTGTRTWTRSPSKGHVKISTPAAHKRRNSGRGSPASKMQECSMWKHWASKPKKPSLPCDCFN